MKINLRSLRLSPQTLAQRGACLVGVIAAALIAAGCATERQYPPAPAPRRAPDVSTYLIGPLDTVNIIVWRNPELSLAVPVRPDGKITTPLVDDLPALAARRRRQLGARHREGARQVASAIRSSPSS